MDTNWRVVKVTATEGRAIAELIRVEWFKKNPAVDVDKVYDEDDPCPEEFIEATPGEDGADFIEFGDDRMSIDVYDALDLTPGDDVMINLFHVERVDA